MDMSIGAVSGRAFCMACPDSLASEFSLGRIISFKSLGTGVINSTYLLCTDKGEFVAQRINTAVLGSARNLMHNIAVVTSHLEGKSIESLHFHKSATGELFADLDGECWRVSDFLHDTEVFDRDISLAAFSKAGRAFGNFDKALMDLDPGALFITIPGFHDPASRLKHLRSSFEKDSHGLLSKAYCQASRLLELESLAHCLPPLPLRITHNDTKTTNILFCRYSHESCCVIDLDTVMPGFLCFDFADSIRYSANKASEDEKDLGKVALDLDLFEAFAAGFLGTLRGELREEEKSSMADGVLVLTYEQAIRFLDDYLCGSPYYRIEHPEHNLERASCQLALLEDMLVHQADMRAICSRILG
jgi:Ser/Thr protein kinase RdoA (MazF antagonist)